MSDPRQTAAVRDSADQAFQSATSYENVTYSSGEYAPSKPFKGLQVGTGGDIKIKGLDEVEVVLSDVPAGVHALAGLAVIETGTAATDITALF